MRPSQKLLLLITAATLLTTNCDRPTPSLETPPSDQVAEALLEESAKVSSSDDCASVNSGKVVEALDVLGQHMAADMYLQMLPCNVQLNVNLTTAFKDAKQDKLDNMRKWGNTTYGVLSVKRMARLRPLKAFKAENDVKLTFVEFPGRQSVYVPEEIAWDAEAAFINGFVTRLVLEESRKPLNLPEIPRIVPQNLKATVLPDNAYASGWINNPNSSTKENYDASLVKLANQAPVQPVALFDGWDRADNLLRNPDAPQKKAEIAAAWQLLRNRLGPEQVGTVVGYTLSYVQGFADNRRTYEAFTSKGGTPAKFKAALEGVKAAGAGIIYARVAPGEEEAPARLNVALFEVLALANAKANFSPLEKAASTRFLIGYNKGAVLSARTVYAETFLAGYRLGYQSGYEQGFKDGYTAGEDAAEGFWKGAVSFANEVQAITKDIQKITTDGAKIAAAVMVVAG